MLRHILTTFVGITVSGGMAFADGTAQVTIVLTGESVGYLEPCGCSDGQLGGIARRHTYVRDLRVRRKHVLLLDLGDLTAGFGRQEQLKAETFVTAMNAMGYGTAAVGERDVFLGLSHLTRLQRQVAKFPLLCANLHTRRRDGRCQRLFPASTIRSMGSSRPHILVVGLLSQEAGELVTACEPSLCVADPAKALSEALSSIDRASRPSAARLRRPDLIVVLAHMPRTEALDLAGAVPGVDFVLCGGDYAEPRPPKRIGKTWVVTCGAQGKQVVEVSFQWRPGARALRPQMANVALDDRYVDSSEMLVVLDGYQTLLKREQILSKWPRTDLGNGLQYVGSQACAECHKQHFARWRGSRHAGAYQTLRRRRRHYDPECVRCHVVGLHYVSGFRSPQRARDLGGVGCESCHGAGSLHCEQAKRGMRSKASVKLSPRLGSRDKGRSAPRYGQTDQSTCTDCHDSAHDPKQRYKLFKTKPHCGFEGADVSDQRSVISNQ